MSGGTLTNEGNNEDQIPAGPRGEPRESREEPDLRRSGSMKGDQWHARAFGVLFIVTFLTSIPAALLLDSVVLDDPAGFIAGSGNENLVYLAVMLEFFLIIANVGTAVVLYPIARRQSRVLALSFVAARIMECVFIAGGIIFVLGVVSLRQDAPGAAELAVSFGALKDWTALFGPGMVVPFGNGLILGYLMFKSGLVPRGWTWLGLIGGPILFFSNLGMVFGWWIESPVSALLVAPEFIWEAFLGIYCAIWGFRRESPILGPAQQGSDS